MAFIPVNALDANCTKALGLPIAALILALLSPGQIIFVGDSQHITDLLSSRRSPSDLFLFYCVELTSDFMGGR